MTNYQTDGTGRITCDYNPTQEEIKVCRDAICREFGNNGTDGYYVRILKAIHASVPKPKADGYRWRTRGADEQWRLVCQESRVTEEDLRLTTTELRALYTYPPDAQAEINSLNATATEREGFIDKLLEDLRVAREQLAKLEANHHD